MVSGGVRKLYETCDGMAMDQGGEAFTVRKAEEECICKRKAKVRSLICEIR